LGTAYTPGLKVSQDAIIRRTRRLPLKGDVLVAAGETVSPDTVVARAALPGLMQTIKVAAQLGIDASDVPTTVNIKEGDTVAKDQVIAATKSFFGLFKSELKSPYSGKVETISSVSGNVGVRMAPSPIDLTAYVSGRIAEILPDEGVVVETRGALIQGIFGVGGERVGTVKMVSANPADTLDEKHITPDLAGKIIVGGGNISGAALRKASDVGVIGIVVGGIIDKDLIAFLGYDIGVAITGHENINITLVITEGFGSIAMASRTFSLLKSLEGKMASINGATQIRAGVIRPEVIVPQTGGVIQSAPHDDEVSSLEIGTRVRLIREPYFGALGAVSGLPPQLTKLESGAMVRVLDAKLDDGSQVTVPRANVEIMAE